MIHSLKDEFDVAVMCDVLEVSRSGYYMWVDRPPSPASIRRDGLIERIRQIHVESDQTYGSPRIHAELIEMKVDICARSVAKYMKRAGIRSKMHRKFKICTTDSKHHLPVFQNKLDRQFTADAPNRKWLCDITYVHTDDGFIYLSAVLDTFSRKIVGWSLSDSLDRSICIDALKSAISGRKKMPGGLSGLLHHSDRGSQYASSVYQELLRAWDITVSMSRVGNCWDNAMMESFFGSFKTELIYREKFQTRQQAKSRIIAWIEGWYNRRRRHSAIGYKSPETFEAELN
jgi:transposase InsO family protein